MKKCATNIFNKKYKDSCQGLCKDEIFSESNPKLCSTENDPESLQEIVEKCSKASYKRKNKEKCEVVERIDIILTSENPEEAGVNEEDGDDASDVKSDIVDSIKRQTQERKNIQKHSNQKNKEKMKQLKGKTKSKSKCNKPKYAATHRAECRDLAALPSVLAAKCRKAKYRAKHRARCQSLGSRDGDNEVFNVVLSQVTDVRCRKESFRWCI